MEEQKEILQLIDKLMTQKRLSKTWVPGKDWVQYAGPYFNSQEYMNSVNSLLNEWLVLGEDADKFEKQFSELFGKKHGLLTNSGSSANLLMMSALKSVKKYNLQKGTKVITPIAGFPTTVNPIFQVGFVPIFVDIELDTLNLNLEQVEHLLQLDPDIKVITFAHVLGNPPNMDKVMELVEKYKLILLEDCCDALGTKYRGKPLGSFGDMASCSFYPAHHITMGEGGIVTVNSDKLERIVRSIRDWGRGCYCKGKDNLSEHGKCNCRFNNWLPNMPKHEFDHKYVYEEIGYNLKPIELQASMGLAQLEKLDEIIGLRKRNHTLLLNIFSKYEDYFILPKAQENSDVSWFAFALTIKDNKKFTRTEFCQFLERNKIQTRPYFAGNLMLQPAYKDVAKGEDYVTYFPNATKATTDTFFLGVSPVITEEQIEYIGTIVDTFFDNKSDEER